MKTYDEIRQHAIKSSGLSERDFDRGLRRVLWVAGILFVVGVMLPWVVGVGIVVKMALV